MEVMEGDIRQASSCEIFCIENKLRNGTGAGKTDDMEHSQEDGWLRES